MMVRILHPRHAMGWSPALCLFILSVLASFWSGDASRVLRRGDNWHPTDGTSSLPETRRLAQKTGTSSVLVVRVTAAGGAEQTKSSLDSIQSVIFDRSPSAQSQFRDCSNGVFTITNGGVIEVTLDYTVQGRPIDSDDEMKNDLIGLVEAQLNTVLPGEFDHVLYCFPPGTTNFGALDWVAFAVYEGYAAYFNDGSCEDVLTVMHEMGHNMGLGHACQFSDGLDTQGEYGDRIGVMGIGDFQTRKCYNGAMSNLLGWYDPKYTTTLDGAPDENILKCLFGSAEYSLQPNADEYQLAYRIGNILVSFNRKTGPNAQTSECEDQVAIHEFPILSVEGLDNSSNRLTCLAAGQSYEGDGYVINVGDIDTTQEPGCARVGIVVQPTQPPTAAPTIVLPPNATPSPTQFPTTQDNRVDFYVENFANEDAITITLIGSCGEVLADTVVNPGEGGSGFFTIVSEDQWRFVIADAGGNGGAKYSVSFRGVPQVALTDMTQAEECHIVGGDSPRCDGDLCPGQTAAPSATSVAPVTPEPVTNSTSSPVPTPSITPDQPTASEPTTSPDQQSTPVPSITPDQPTMSEPTIASENTPEPTSSTSDITPVPSRPTGPTLPPVNTVSPVSAAGTCDVQVRVEGCGALIQSQSPIPGCNCYNYCNGVFLGCCAFDVFCEVYCPSDNFVGGCVLEDDATLAPTGAPIENPQPRPTMRPLPPSGDEPAPPTYPPLPPSGDFAEGTCLRQERTSECASLIAFQSPLNNCACYNYCDGVYIGCCEFDSSCRISECPSGNLVAGCRLDGREDAEGSNTGEQDVVIPVSPSFLETSIWNIWGDRTGGRRRRLRDLFPPMGKVGRRGDDQNDDPFVARN